MSFPIIDETDFDNISEAQRYITSWANKEFPHRTPDGTLIKFYSEMGEFSEDRNALEFADLLILLFDLASMYNINIAEAVEEKMRINQARKWNYNIETGLARHVEE